MGSWDGQGVGSMEYIHYAAVTALILAALQGFGPRIRTQFKAHASEVSSFGGGVALAYAFLQLFPEIDLAHEWLGEHVHSVTLVSFLIFYVLEIAITGRWGRKRAVGIAADGGSPGATARTFWFHVAIIWIYTWMVMFTLPDGAADSLAFAILGGATIGIHLIYKDYVFRRHYEERFQATGSLVLATAPLAGWIAHEFLRPSEAVLDVFIAVLAGVLLQSVFKDELPDEASVRLPWLLGGVATYAALVAIS